MPREPRRRRIVGAELDVFPLGLGGNVFGMTADAAASEAVLDAFVEGGGNMIDTADSYSAWAPGNRGGESETILGAWMRRRRNRHQVIMATKVGAHPELNSSAVEPSRRSTRRWPRPTILPSSPSSVWPAGS